jgi:hypothetical protein
MLLEIRKNTKAAERIIEPTNNSVNDPFIEHRYGLVVQTDINILGLLSTP